MPGTHVCKRPAAAHATLAVVVGLRRLPLPLILAFLLVGMVVGPHALGWVAATETTGTLAEFGVVFLLFTLGLEFSLPRMLASRGEVFWLGGIQVVATTTAVAAIAWAFGLRSRLALLGRGRDVVDRQRAAPAHGQDELNRTHDGSAFARCSSSLASVPFSPRGVLAAPRIKRPLDIAFASRKPPLHWSLLAAGPGSPAALHEIASSARRVDPVCLAFRRDRPPPSTLPRA